MRKICIVTGNRSEYSRLKSIMTAINNHPKLKLILFVTASHLLDDYGKTIDIIKRDGFYIDAVARTVAAGEDLASMAKSVGLCALELPTLFEMYKPDIVLVLGDRYDAIGTAVTASIMNIPVAHTQGGEITGTIDESIRHAITKLSHIHLPATQTSANRLIKMGENPKNIYITGCPSVDIILDNKIGSKQEALDRLLDISTDKTLFDIDKPYLIVVQHPVTTEYNHTRKQIKETLEAIKELELQTIMLYPNIDAGSKDMIREMRLKKWNGYVRMYKHIPFELFISLMAHCSCMVGNSSAGIRETCYFGTPTVNIGTRQNCRERGKNVIDVGYNKDKIKGAILESIERGRYKPEYIYGKGKAGIRTAEILATIDIDNIVQKRLMI